MFGVSGAFMAIKRDLLGGLHFALLICNDCMHGGLKLRHETFPMHGQRYKQKRRLEMKFYVVLAVTVTVVLGTFFYMKHQENQKQVAAAEAAAGQHPELFLPGSTDEANLARMREAARLAEEAEAAMGTDSKGGVVNRAAGTMAGAGTSAMAGAQASAQHGAFGGNAGALVNSSGSAHALDGDFADSDIAGAIASNQKPTGLTATHQARLLKRVKVTFNGTAPNFKLKKRPKFDHFEEKYVAGPEDEDDFKFSSAEYSHTKVKAERIPKSNPSMSDDLLIVESRLEDRARR